MNWNELFKPHFIWLLVGLCLLIAEFAAPGLLIFFFGLGALLVGAICYATDLSLNAQLVLFLVSSVGLLLALRQSFSRVFAGGVSDQQHAPEDSLEVVGEHAKVVRAIEPDEAGQVEFHGTHWQAAADEPLPVGAAVEVIGRENLTLLVRSLHPADDESPNLTVK